MKLKIHFFWGGGGGGGTYWDNGKENGNYYLGFRGLWLGAVIGNQKELDAGHISSACLYLQVARLSPGIQIRFSV